MASTTPLVLILLTLIPFLTLAQKAPAPAPSGPINITGILDKGSQYTFLIRLLNETQQLTQIQSQLNSTSQGFTIFAPTDNAFQNLPSGAINDLSDEQKVQLILYHVTPKYYSLSDFLTVSNPVRTQASDKSGPWGLHFTSQGNQVNVSSGVVTEPINNALRQKFPLAVYQLDKVLLPTELFGPKAPASSPAPKSSKTPSKTPSSAAVEGDAPSPASSKKDESAAGRNVGFGFVVGVGLICMAVLA
ncbi:fasciclin-like arabinogalactan protein 13 [Vicia villosa]|uniref:fasciclin-like arabinogalactan protein 13 n=1 Tax=Vicia villosa TaxID=3911 RepID=UPI00273C074C|nr:fasciclin-like arabinogalactan protein 13 [Vicia villosa]